MFLCVYSDFSFDHLAVRMKWNGIIVFVVVEPNSVTRSRTHINQED